MTTQARVRVAWNGLGGLPGVSTFYYPSSAPVLTGLTSFFNSIKSLVPDALSWTIPNSGDTIDMADGSLVGGWIGTGGGTVQGIGGASPYAAGVGTRVVWNTLGIAGGRRVRGATFIAPILASNFDSAGTIATAALNTIQTAASSLAASGVAWGVWSRPTDTRAGTFHATNDAIVADRVTALRSRRY